MRLIKATAIVLIPTGIYAGLLVRPDWFLPPLIVGCIAALIWGIYNTAP